MQNTGGAKAETVVVLENLKGKAPAARTVTVEIGGLDARPRLLIVGPGSVVEIKHRQDAARAFDAGCAEDHAHRNPAPWRYPPAAVRRAGWVRHPRQRVPTHHGLGDRGRLALLLDPHEKGSFSIAGVPDGKANLKVWTRGRWASEQEVDTATAVKDELTVRVTAAKDSAESKDTKEGAE